MMRELKLKEIEAVAGGGCGSRIPEFNAPGCGSTVLDPGSESEGGDIYYWQDAEHSGGSVHGAEPLPQGNIEAIREHAADLARLLGRQAHEGGAFLYLINGRLEASNFVPNPTLSSNRLAVDILNLAIPRGALVVAYLHNHPNGHALPSHLNNTTDASRLENDWAARNAWVTNDYSHWGISVDPNLLLYIATRDELREYTSADERTRETSDGLLVN